MTFSHPQDAFLALELAELHGYCSAGMMVRRSAIEPREARQVLEELEAIGCLVSETVGKTMRYHITSAGENRYEELRAELYGWHPAATR